jgi:hypothetical protein
MGNGVKKPFNALKKVPPAATPRSLPRLPSARYGYNHIGIAETSKPKQIDIQYSNPMYLIAHGTRALTINQSVTGLLRIDNLCHRRSAAYVWC